MITDATPAAERSTRSGRAPWVPGRLRRRHRVSANAPQAVADFAAAAVLASLSPEHWQIAADVERETQLLVAALLDTDEPGEWLEVHVDPIALEGRGVDIRVTTDTGRSAEQRINAQAFLRRRRD